MAVALCFGLALVGAVLISDVARRSILSTSVLFLAVGVVFGGVFGVINISVDEKGLETFIEVTVIAALFTDGMEIDLGESRRALLLPIRALVLGIPLTIAGIVVVGYALLGAPWSELLLLAAVLSPTDPVFAAAIVGRTEVSARLRRLLNLESGLNDGLALPIVVVLIGVTGSQSISTARAVGEAAGGAGLGAMVAVAAAGLLRLPRFQPAGVYTPLYAVAVGIVAAASAVEIGVNEFLAAFVAGITFGVLKPGLVDAYGQIGAPVAEVLKLASLLVFGALLSPHLLAEVGVRGYAFAVITLLVVRPLALLIALGGGPLTRREFIVAAWFGPRGFTSVLYALLVVSSGTRGSIEIFHEVAIVVALSVLLHSSTDVLAFRWLEAEEANEEVAEFAQS